MAAAANAQQTPPTPPTPMAPLEYKVVAEVAASTERIVKGSPFSAESVSESVQTLSDGNRIIRSSTTKMYRSGDGRFRREVSESSGGVLGSVYQVSPSISIIDPVAGFRYSLNPESRTARSTAIRSAPYLIAPRTTIGNLTGALTMANAGTLTAQEKMNAELDAVRAAQLASKASKVVLEGHLATVAAAPAASPIAVEGQRLTEALRAAEAVTVVGNGGALVEGLRSKNNTRTEQLGVQNFEGVDAVGTRTTTTIEAGKIGNERPIEIIYESWYSKDLQMIVYSKHSDPRSGEQTYRLTNINRSEPDPSLFTVPPGYTMQSQAVPLLKYAPRTVEGTHYLTVKNPTAARPSAKTPTAATSVRSTKP